MALQINIVTVAEQVYIEYLTTIDLCRTPECRLGTLGFINPNIVPTLTASR